MNGNYPAGDWDSETTVAWMEYDSAADWCAAHGLLGCFGGALPEGLSRRAAELIDADPEAFERRVREMAYARSQKGQP